MTATRTIRLLAWACLAVGLLSAPPTRSALAAGDPAPGTPAADEAATILDRAHRAFRQGRVDDAEALWIAALDDDPAAGGAHAGLVRIALRRHDVAAAEQLGRRGLASAPGNPVVETAWGEVLLRGGAFAEAEASFAAAARADPACSRAWLGLGRVRLATYRGDAGIAALREARRMDDADPEIARLFAGTLARREDAVAELERYLDIGTGEPEPFRTGARETIALYEALGDRPVWTRLTSPDRAEVRLGALVSGSGSGGLLLPVRLGGKKVRCLLDTGAAGLYLSPSAARRASTEEVSLSTVFGGGGDGEHASRRVIVDRVDVGGVVFGSALAHVAENELDPRGRYQCITGIGRLAPYRLEIDPRKRRLVLERHPAGGDGADLPPAAAHVAPRRLDGGETPLFDVGGQLLVRARAGQADRERSLLLLFDTGAVTSILDVEAARTLGRVSDSPGSVRTFGGRAGAAGVLRGAFLSLGDVRLANRDLKVIDLAWRAELGGVGVDGYLGYDLLRQRRLVIDLRRGVVLLEPLKRKDRGS